MKNPVNRLLLPFFLLTAALVFPVFGQEKAPLSKELAQLKTGYHAAVSKAVTPLTETYRRELQRLMENFTRAGKLEEALQVKNELDSLTAGTPPSVTSTTTMTAPPTPEAPVQGPPIANTVWTSKKGFLLRIEFLGDGRIIATNQQEKKYTAWTYKSNPDGTVTIHATPNPRPGSFKFTKRGALFEGLFEEDYEQEFELETKK